MKYLFLILFGIFTLSVSAQEIFDLNFDDCSTLESILAITPSERGLTECVCGVSGNALQFDGETSLSYSGLGDMLNQPFGMSFYVFVDRIQNNQAIQLLTYGSNECTFDSNMVIRYLPLENSIEHIIAEDQTFKFQTMVAFQDNKCWHHVVFNRFTDQVQLIIDGVPSEPINIPPGLKFKKGAILELGGGPCDMFQQQNLIGIIDEFTFNSQPIDFAQYTMNPDQFENADTTIYRGQSLTINTGSICTESFLLTPDFEVVLSNKNTLNFDLQPTESTQLNLQVTYDNCIASDKLVVNVINEEDLQCERILLPTGFTPNNDNLNDNFGISNTFIVDEVSEFIIYNRWGTKIFQGHSKNSRWDGTFNNKIMESGTYQYTIRYRCGGVDYNYQSSVALIR